VIKLFEEKGTVDEIGIGSVRDALSDVLFPGTSVLQTRARYFFLVPAVYQHLEENRTESAAVAKEGRRLELSLIDRLLESKDPAGTIGRIAKGSLKVLPSTIYWNGLGVWGIRRFDGSQDQYHRLLDRFYRQSETEERDNDGQVIHGGAVPNWHSGLPAMPPGFPKCALSLRLSAIEAEYLKERLLTACRGTLLAHLVDACSPAEELPFVWAHPESRGFSDQISDQVLHARNFSETIHGAALLYNLMLAEKRVGTMAVVQEAGEELVESYRAKWTRWAESLTSRASELHEWSRRDFWALVIQANPRVPHPTRAFVDEWLDLALTPEPHWLRDLPRARNLILSRERAIKRRLARLENPDALARWNRASGAGQLSYRWDPQVRRIVTDIQVGLRADA
jgi:hypothetical protein